MFWKLEEAARVQPEQVAIIELAVVDLSAERNISSPVCLKEADTHIELVDTFGNEHILFDFKLFG